MNVNLDSSDWTVRRIHAIIWGKQSHIGTILGTFLLHLAAGKVNVKMENVTAPMVSLVTIVKIGEQLVVIVSASTAIAPNQSPVFAILDFLVIFVK